MRNISDEELQELLAKSPAERITAEYINSRIKNVEYSRIGATMTLCIIHLDNGFMIDDTSACVNEANYNKLMGEKISYDNAYRKLWKLFGFLLAEKNMLRAGVVDA